MHQHTEKNETQGNVQNKIMGNGQHVGVHGR